MAWLSAYLPAPAAVMAFSVIDALAGTTRIDGDERTVDQRRADAFADVFTTILTNQATPDGTPLPRRHGQAVTIGVTVAATTLAGLDEQPGLPGLVRADHRRDGPRARPGRDLAAPADRPHRASHRGRDRVLPARCGPDPHRHRPRPRPAPSPDAANPRPAATWTTSNRSTPPAPRTPRPPPTTCTPSADTTTRPRPRNTGTCTATPTPGSPGGPAPTASPTPDTPHPPSSIPRH